METRLAKDYLSIRRATPNDAPALTALHAESFGAAKWSLAQIVDSLALQTTLAPVACEGKTIKGFLFCQVVRDEAEMLTFCVSPSTRRKGVGLFLLNVIVAALRQKKVKRLFLEVGADNKAAVTLYEKLGFIVTGKRPGYYIQGGKSIDALMMTLDL